MSSTTHRMAEPGLTPVPASVVDGTLTVPPIGALRVIPAILFGLFERPLRGGDTLPGRG